MCSLTVSILQKSCQHPPKFSAERSYTVQPFSHRLRNMATTKYPLLNKTSSRCQTTAALVSCVVFSHAPQTALCNLWNSMTTAIIYCSCYVAPDLMFCSERKRPTGLHQNQVHLTAALFEEVSLVPSLFVLDGAFSRIPLSQHMCTGEASYHIKL